MAILCLHPAPLSPVIAYQTPGEAAVNTINLLTLLGFWEHDDAFGLAVILWCGQDFWKADEQFDAGKMSDYFGLLARP